MSSIIQLGNINIEGNFKNPQTGRVYSKDGLSPTITTMGGGNRQPKVIVENKAGKIEMEENTKNVTIIDSTYGFEKEPRIYDEIRPTLRSERFGLKVVKEEKKDFYDRMIEDSDGEICGTLLEQSEHFGYRKPMKGIARTIKAEHHDSGVVKNYAIRKLTPKECWRLMGFFDEDIEKATAVGISNSQLYKQAGNSIVVDVLYYIFKNLYEAMPYLFDDLKVSSYFSGIGAFEKALDRLYENDIITHCKCEV